MLLEEIVSKLGLLSVFFVRVSRVISWIGLLPPTKRTVHVHYTN
jgi:hypothetical protein